MKKINYPWILFNIKGTVYGISCEPVVSMVILSDVTNVAKVPEYVRGVTNLRGRIVPLVDIRKMLGLKSLQEEINDFYELMDARKQDHIEWLTTLENSVRNNTEFTLTTDPHACKFGKWYDSFQTNDTSLRFLLNKFDQPHKKIHSIAIDTKKLQEKQDFKGAEELVESVKNTDLQRMIELFAVIKEEYKNSKREIVIVIENTKSQLGLIVDEVVSVENLSELEEESMEENMIDKEIFTGIAKRKNGFPVFLLNYEKVFNALQRRENMQ